MERIELGRDNDNSQRIRIGSQPCSSHQSPNHMTRFCEWAKLHTFRHMPESDCERVVVTPFTLPIRYFHANKAIYAGGQIRHRPWQASKTNATMTDAVSTPNTIETLREQLMLVFFVSPKNVFRSASAQRRAHMTHWRIHARTEFIDAADSFSIENFAIEILCRLSLSTSGEAPHDSDYRSIHCVISFFANRFSVEFSHNKLSVDCDNVHTIQINDGQKKVACDR